MARFVIKYFNLKFLLLAAKLSFVGTDSKRGIITKGESSRYKGGAVALSNAINAIYIPPVRPSITTSTTLRFFRALLSAIPRPRDAQWVAPHKHSIDL